MVTPPSDSPVCRAPVQGEHDAGLTLSGEALALVQDLFSCQHSRTPDEDL